MGDILSDDVKSARFLGRVARASCILNQGDRLLTHLFIRVHRLFGHGHAEVRRGRRCIDLHTRAGRSVCKRLKVRIKMRTSPFSAKPDPSDQGA